MEAELLQDGLNWLLWQCEDWFTKPLQHLKRHGHIPPSCWDHACVAKSNCQRLEPDTPTALVVAKTNWHAPEYQRKTRTFLGVFNNNTAKTLLFYHSIIMPLNKFLGQPDKWEFQKCNSIRDETGCVSLFFYCVSDTCCPRNVLNVGAEWQRIPGSGAGC